MRLKSVLSGMGLKVSVSALFLTMVTAMIPVEVSAKSWEQAIREVDARVDALWARGRALGAETNLGSALNEIDVPRHQCAILGHMLDRADYITALEENPEPQLSTTPTEGELMDLMIYARSLSNWSYVARSLLDQDEGERAHLWNLNCVGNMGIPQEAAVAIDAPQARFEVRGSDLVVLGDIQSGFAAALFETLNDNPAVTRVVLGGGGGSANEAMLAGGIIRDRGLDTTLLSNCSAACPLVFLGGVNRTIWSPYPTLGFQQLTDAEGAPIKTSDDFYVAIEDYAVAMGADASFILVSMLRAVPPEIYTPELGALCEHRVATWIQRLC